MRLNEKNNELERKETSFQSAVEALTAPTLPDSECRREPRIPRTIQLEIEPLDLDFQPNGNAFSAVSRDVSNSGLGIIHSAPIQHEFIRIAMPDQTDATVIARVCYNLSIGIEDPLFLIGVQFVS